MSNPYLDKLLSLEPDWVLGYTFRDSGNDRVWDDDSGSAGDYDVVLNDGTERTEGGPTNDTDARWVYFDGTASNWGAAAEGITGLTDYTMSAWVRTPNRDQLARSIFSCYNHTDGDYRSWSLQFRGTGTSTHNTRYAIIRSTNGSSIVLTQVATSVPLNDTWDHIVVTRSGTTVTFYRNGVSRGTVTDDATYFSTANAFFALAKAWDDDAIGIIPFNGDIYTPSLWTRALTSQEITELYTASEETPDIIQRDYNTELEVLSPYGVNDFSEDSDVLVHWRFEQGALTTNEKSAHNLVANGSPTADTSVYREGAASAALNAESSQYFSLADNMVSWNFPGKGGTAFTIMKWFRFPDPLPATLPLFNKWNGTDLRCFDLQYNETDQLLLRIGHNSGGSAEVLHSGVYTPTTEDWLHVLWSYNYSTRAWKLRVWNDTIKEYVLDVSGTATNTMSNVASTYWIGRDAETTTNYLSGNVDQGLIFTRTVSNEDQDKIIAGVYGHPESDPHPIDDAVALWRFEEGALTVDSAGNNTLTAINNPTADTVDFKEGSASAQLVRTSEQYFELPESGMDAAFPLQSGTTDRTISVAGWFKYDPLLESTQGLWGKYQAHQGHRCWMVGINSAGHFVYYIGYNSGDSFEVLYDDEGATVHAGVWYHGKATFDDGAWTLRVWNDATEEFVIDASGTATNTMHLISLPFHVGFWPIVGWPNLHVDQTAVWNRVVTHEEQDAIIGLAAFPIDKTYNTELTVTASVIDRAYNTQLIVNLMMYAWDFDGACLHPDSTIADAETSSPSMTLVPRIVNTRNNGLNIIRWNWFHFRLYNAEGKTPTFSINFAEHISIAQSGGSPHTDWRPWYSYDGVEWIQGTEAWTGSSNGIVTFHFGTPFTENEVYVAYTSCYPVWRVRMFLNGLIENHSEYLHEIPSTTTEGNHVIGYVAAQTDDLNRSLPAIEMIGYGIWDDVGAETRKIGILTAAIHASEQISNGTYERFILWLLSDNPRAEWLRKNFKFYCYPLVNPQGRFGGHRRGQWDPADLSKDMNRDWVDLSLQATNLIHDAVLTDVPGNADFANDFHDITLLSGTNEPIMWYVYANTPEMERWKDALSQFGTYTYQDGTIVGNTSSWMASVKNSPIANVSENLVQTSHTYEERVVTGEYMAEALYEAYYEGEIDRSYNTELTVQGDTTEFTLVIPENNYTVTFEWQAGDIQIDWGDGTVVDRSDGGPGTVPESHEYVSAGTYTVALSGEVTSIIFGYGPENPLPIGEFLTPLQTGLTVTGWEYHGTFRNSPITSLPANFLDGWVGPEFSDSVSFYDMFRGSSLESLDPGFFDLAIAWQQANPEVRAVGFFRAFQDCVSFTGALPELWEVNWVRDTIGFNEAFIGEDTFLGCTSASNWLSVPYEWGGLAIHDMSPVSIETGAALLGQPSLEDVEPGIVDLLAASVETGIPILGTPTLTTPIIGRRYRVYKRVS